MKDKRNNLGKRLKYWIKGGIIGFIFGLIIPLVLMFSNYNVSQGLPFFIIFPICSLFNIGRWFCVRSVFLNPLVYALIGILIGYIIDKIKDKK